MDRKYLITAFIYGIIGLALGIWMAATMNHRQMPTHAHVLLLGFVVTFIYAVSYKVWALPTQTKIAAVQFWLHQLGVIGLTTGLFLLYGGFVDRDTLDPVLGVASVLALLAFMCMAWQAVKKS